MLTRDALTRLCRARDRLHETGEDALSIDRIAREAGLTPYHFIRRFNALFGQTPHQYRTTARLEEARRLLLADGASVTDVCMAVGFSSLGSFSALFTRHVGEPPSGYRRRLYPSIALSGRLPTALTPGCITLMNAAWAAQSQFSRSNAAVPLQHCAASKTTRSG